MKEKSIDEITVFEASEAVESDKAKIRCPNGCYEPYKLTNETLRAATDLPLCEQCESNHLIRWEDQ